MMNIKLPVGRSGFADIRKNHYYFVDKSRLIEELLKTEATQVTLITRPRRFGKTLNMSMLSAFFDIRRDSGELFDGLLVTENRTLCELWMNQYPVLSLSLKSVNGLNFASAYARLTAVMAELYKDHLYLMDSKMLNVYDKEYFDRIAAKKASAEEVGDGLLKLTRFLESFYDRPVIVLIDEYDVPLAKASERGYYTEMLDTVKSMMQAVKDNEALKFAVITGCLRVAKESIFTGTNNFVSDTISDTRLDEYFGFTQAELDRLLSDMQLMEHREEMKEWYDGYHFGNFDVYCPWDVMNHVKNLLLDPEIRPIGYWKNSSDNAIVRSFIDFAGETITKKLETLMSGGTVIQRVREDLTYDYLNSSEENLWSILYLTGYLTRAKTGTVLPKESLALTIPNAEVLEVFESSIKSWFEENARQADRKPLFSALWNGDERQATEEISRLLRKTISYHDYREDFYHVFLTGIFAGAGYMVESNREHGEGRSDITVQDYTGDRAAVFEIKYSKDAEGLGDCCKKALAQIEEKGYARELEDDYAQVICYGIAFFKKRCLVCRKK